MKNDDRIKLDALEYAEKNKIVNQKSIDAYIAGYKNCKAEHTSKEMIQRLFDMFYNSDQEIKTESETAEAYSGYKIGQDTRKKMLEKQKFALAIRKAYDDMIINLGKE